MSVVDREGLVQLQRLVIAPGQLQDQQIALSAQQQHYLGRVLRLRAGDRFIAMDGAGHWWLSELQAGQQAQVLEAISAQTELPVPITLIAAPPKGNGFEAVVCQATELGVSQILPILSDLTLAHPSPQKLERWRRIAQEAAEQSERQVVPPVLDPVSFAQGLAALAVVASPCQRYFCVTRHDAPHLLHCLQRVTQLPIVVATGPEGGWTATEVNQAIAAGYQPVSLGRRILRTVTAPLTALSLVAARLECAQAEEGMQ